MFIAKVAYLVVADLPEAFHELEYNLYNDEQDGAYFEIENAHFDELKTLGILSEDEHTKLTSEDVSYVMLWVPA